MKYFTLFLIFLFFSIGYTQSYDLLPGYTYKMLDFPVNIRSQPNTSAEIIGKLGLNDKIIILENTHKEQQIDGIDQYWYKIGFDNIIGYIWGGYCAIGDYVFDIDKNGINDYVYFRFRDRFDTIKTRDDIFVYINNKRIPFNTDDWDSYNICYAFEKSGEIYIKLAYDSGDPYIFMNVYQVDANGKIIDMRLFSQTFKSFYTPTLSGRSVENNSDEPELKYESVEDNSDEPELKSEQYLNDKLNQTSINNNEPFYDYARVKTINITFFDRLVNIIFTNKYIIFILILLLIGIFVFSLYILKKKRK